MKKIPSLGLYLVLTFTISYGVWGIYILGQWVGLFSADSNWLIPFLMIGANAPPTAAYVVLKRADKDFSFKRFIKLALNVKQKPLYYAFAVFIIALSFAIPAVTSGLGTGFIPGLETQGITESMPLYMTLLGIPLMFFVGGSEEIGWRGVLQPELEKRLSFIPTAFVISVIWTLWHIPLWFIAGSAQADVNFGLFFIMCIGLSFAFTAVRRVSGSVFLCVLMHCAINSLQGTWTVKDDLLTRTSTTLVLIAFSLIIIFWHNKSQKRKNVEHDFE